MDGTFTQGKCPVNQKPHRLRQGATKGCFWSDCKPQTSGNIQAYGWLPLALDLRNLHAHEPGSKFDIHVAAVAYEVGGRDVTAMLESEQMRSVRYVDVATSTVLQDTARRAVNLHFEDQRATVEVFLARNVQNRVRGLGRLGSCACDIRRQWRTALAAERSIIRNLEPTFVTEHLIPLSRKSRLHAARSHGHAKVVHIDCISTDTFAESSRQGVAV